MSSRMSLRAAIAAALLVVACGASAQSVPAKSAPAKSAPAKSAPPPIGINDSARPALPPDLADFAAYVDKARSSFGVPGIAVAIVKDGQVVMEQGFGDKSLDPRQPVDAHTLFAIASNTKAFTAAALQQLD